jgi:hypothetical protein
MHRAGLDDRSLNRKREELPMLRCHVVTEPNVEMTVRGLRVEETTARICSGLMPLHMISLP